MIIVDTSTLIDFFRGGRSESAMELQRMDLEGQPFGIPTICCQELLQGSKSEREWKQLRDYLFTQMIVPMPASLDFFMDAGRIYYDCARNGYKISGTVDCLIASLTLREDAALLHQDSDYTKIARVRPKLKMVLDR